MVAKLGWLRHDTSPVGTAGCSQGREPLVYVASAPKAPEGRQERNTPFAPPGLRDRSSRLPGARAPGYSLSPLRGWKYPTQPG